MPATPINWKLYSYNKEVIKEVDSALRWFSAECPNSNTISDPTTLRINVAKEMGNLKTISPKPYLTYAIYQLYLDKFILNPLSLTSQNIDDAIWATNKIQYLNSPTPSSIALKNLPFSRFEL